MTATNSPSVESPLPQRYAIARLVFSALLAGAIGVALLGCSKAPSRPDEATEQVAPEAADPTESLIREALTSYLPGTRHRALDQLTDQSAVAQVATASRHEDTIEYAIGKLTDPALLLAVATNGADWSDVYNRRQRAVESQYVQDQEALAHIAATETMRPIHIAALNKVTNDAIRLRIAPWVDPRQTAEVTDQDLLARIAREAGRSDVQRAALGKITDPSERHRAEAWVDEAKTTALEDAAELARIARHASRPNLREAALRNANLTDRSVIVSAARHDPLASIRGNATELITNATVLTEILTTDGSDSVRAAAVRNQHLADPAILARAAITDDSALVARIAANRVADPSLIEAIATQAKSSKARASASARVADGQILVQIARDRGNDAEVRIAAIANPNLVDAAALKEVALGATSPRVRAAAARRVSDRATLATLAGDDECTVRRAAVGNEHFTDQQAIARIAQRDLDIDVRATASAKLTDPKLLAHLAVEEDESSNAIAIIKRIRDQDAHRYVIVRRGYSDVGRATLAAVTNKAFRSAMAPWVSREALREVKDQDLLAKIAAESHSVQIPDLAYARITDETVKAEVEPWVSSYVTKEVTDAALLARIAVHAGSWGVREVAARNKNLTDQSLLAYIAATDSSSTVRQAAAARINDPALRVKLLKKHEGFDELLKEIEGHIRAAGVPPFGGAPSTSQ